jgi:chitin synthase
VGEGPLQKYFLGETMVCFLSSTSTEYLLICQSKHGAGADIFTANMYLAEDRVCFFSLRLLFLTKSSV